MIHWAIIRNLESDKNIAVLVHDEDTGRIVYKIRPSDALLQKSLDIFVDRSVVVQEEDPVLGFMKRRRILKTDPDYLAHFVDKAIDYPYEIRSLASSEDETSMDQVADEMYEDQVAFREASHV